MKEEKLDFKKQLLTLLKDRNMDTEDYLDYLSEHTILETYQEILSSCTVCHSSLTEAQEETGLCEDCI